MKGRPKKPVEIEMQDFTPREMKDFTPSPSTFESLPNELNEQVINHLGAGSIIHLSSTSKHFYSLFNEKRQVALPSLKKLLNYVAKGNQDEAEKLLKLFPDLLTCKGTVVDYSGRIIEGTALQIALGAEDVGYQKDEECMVEMIQRYMKQLPDAEKEMAKQIAEQFPDGWEKIEEERAKNDSEALRKVIDAISKSQPGDDCEAALQEFRDYLKPKGVIKTGKHFNAQLLVEAFKLYDKNYDRYCFVGWYNRQKNILCWRKVIGYIERFLPACYAQAFCQDIYYIVEDRKKLNRSLTFRSSGASFFPLDSDPIFRLGVDYAALRWQGDDGYPAQRRTWYGSFVSVAAFPYLSNLMSSKNSQIGKLTYAARVESSSIARVFNAVR